MLPARAPLALFETYSEPPEPGPYSELFRREGTSAAARDALISFGLLQPSADPASAGSMHQLVQRCVRERIVRPAISAELARSTSASDRGECESAPELTRTASNATSLAIECAAGAVSELRSVLTQRFQYNADPSSWAEMRALAPCIDRWHQLCTPDNGLSPDDREVEMLN